MMHRLLLIACAGLVAGCASVPRSGPLTGDIYAEAEAPGPLPFALVEVDAALIGSLGADPGHAGLAPLGVEAPIGTRIAGGDRIAISLFEATGGGLFGGAEETGGAMRSLPVQTVSESGRVQVPYGGSVRIAGLTPGQAARRIEAALAGQAIEPQAVVGVVASPSAAVTVLGDAVARGARVPLSGTGERVLDVVAAAGGISKPIHESALRLTRRQTSGTVDLAHLLEDPAQNIPVRAADVISVEHRPRRFTVLGAVTENARLDFDRVTLSLADGISMARGLIDARADPTGVFVIRHEKRTTLEDAPLAAGRLGEGPVVPAVYHVDLSRPSGLLLAQRFPLRHDDTLYVANSELSSAEKIMRIVALALQPVTTGAVIGNLVTN